MQIVKTQMQWCILSGSGLFAKIIQSSGTEVHDYLEVSTCDHFKYIMGNPILVVLICMGKG